MKTLDWLFCRHSYRFDRNIYGDEIILCGYKRSKWVCGNCGKIQFRAELEAQP